MGLKQKLNTLFTLVKNREYEKIGYSMVLNLSPLLYQMGLHRLLLRFVSQKTDFICLGSNPHSKRSDFFVSSVASHSTIPTDSKGYFILYLWQFYLKILGGAYEHVAYCHNYGLRKDTLGLEKLLAQSLSKKPTVVWTSDPIYELKEALNHKTGPDNRYFIGRISYNRDQVEAEARELYFLCGGSWEKPNIKALLEELKTLARLPVCFSATLLNRYGKLAGGGALFVDAKELEKDTAKTFAKVASFVGIPWDSSYYDRWLSQYTLELPNTFYSAFPYYLDFGVEDGFRYEGRMGLMSYSFAVMGLRSSTPSTPIPEELYRPLLDFNDSNFVLVLTGKNQKENLEYFRCNPHKLRRFCELFSVFYNVAQQRIEELSQYDVSIQDILDYFKNNRDTYREFRDFLETEMCLIKQYAPEIVAQWAAYREFLEID